MAKKIYKLPLSEADREEVKSIYEGIFLNEPHFNMKDENILKAIMSNDDSVGYTFEDEEEDKQNEITEPETKEQEDNNEDDSELNEQIELYIKNYGEKPNDTLKLEDLKLANSLHSDAKALAKQANQPTEKQPKKEVDLTGKVKIEKGGKTLYVNNRTFTKFLSNDGWNLVADKPKELKQ